MGSDVGAMVGVSVEGSLVGSIETVGAAVGDREGLSFCNDGISTNISCCGI